VLARAADRLTIRAVTSVIVSTEDIHFAVGPIANGDGRVNRMRIENVGGHLDILAQPIQVALSRSGLAPRGHPPGAAVFRAGRGGAAEVTAVGNVS
jgi:hypothetical protein